jgi:hypothetical protein
MIATPWLVVRRVIVRGEHRLLVRLGGRIVVQRELQLGAIVLLRRGHRQPAKRVLADVDSFDEAEDVGVEAQGLLLVVQVDAGQLDLHA